MGILDTIIRQLAGPSAARPWLPRVMEGLLAPAPDGVGLHELVARMNKAGMAATVQSWIGAGANLPISAQQLREILGTHDLARICAHAGLNEQEVLGELVEHLPGVIERLSADGHLPA